MEPVPYNEVCSVSVICIDLCWLRWYDDVFGVSDLLPLRGWVDVRFEVRLEVGLEVGFEVGVIRRGEKGKNRRVRDLSYYP